MISVAIALDKRIENTLEQIKKCEEIIDRENKKKNELNKRLQELNNEKKARELKRLEVVLDDKGMTMEELLAMLKNEKKNTL